MEFPKYLKFGAYHWKQYDDNTKYTRHANRVVEWIKERPVLDIGAGDGKITSLLGERAYGFDNEEEAVRLAQEKGAPVSLGDAYQLPAGTEHFKAVFMGDVLEHLEDPRKALREAHRVTKQYLYIACPTKGDNNDKFHYQEWTPEELQELVESEGFRLVEPILVVKEDKRIYGKFEKVGKEANMEEVSMSPVPNKRVNTYSFTDALKELINGRRITRLEWGTNEEFGLLKDEWLMIYRNGQFYQWIVSKADMEATDWCLLPEVN